MYIIRLHNSTMNVYDRNRYVYMYRFVVANANP